MAYYKSPEDMFRRRADNAQKAGNRHWAMAKNGEGDHHYGQAKKCYDSASENRKRAVEAKAKNATFKK